MRRSLAVLALVAMIPCRALAQPPAPIDPSRFAYPGSVTSPASGASAALALADRWLGEEPFSNPAVDARRGFSISPLFQRVSRQDLSASNRDFSDQSGYLDFAGAWVSWPVRGAALSAYFTQPEVRLEDNAYTLGLGLVPGPSASITTSASAREMRGGVGLSAGTGTVRYGVAGEWTRREDHYGIHTQSGSPDDGDQSVDFSGSGFGAQAGVRVTSHAGRHDYEVGAAARMTPSLTLDGTQQFNLNSGSSSSAIQVRRASGWEGGVSARFEVSDGFHVLGSVGGRGAQAWEGFSVTSGAGSEWKVAAEYHDSELPWTARFGFGAERQSDVPEPRTQLVALGFGWLFSSVKFDAGLTHRTLERDGHPNSYEDRAVASISLR